MLFFILTTFSCEKSKNSNHWIAEITSIRFSSASELFKNLPVTALRNNITSNDSRQSALFINEIANKIASYCYSKLNVDIRNKFIDNPNGIIILGLYLAAKEQ